MNSSDFLPLLLPLLLDAALKSALVLLLAAGLLWLLPKASAATKHLFWAVALCACLSLPVLALVVPSWRLPLLPDPVPPMAQSRRYVRAQVTKITYAPHLDEFAFVQAMPAKKSMPPPVSFDWKSGLLALWAIGAWIVIAQMLIGTVLVWLLMHKAYSLRSAAWQALSEEVAQLLGLKRKITLLASQDAAMPMTWGIWKPVVLLPAEALQWPREQVKTVLLHECAHIKRHDYLTQLLATFACTLYWFNPLVWLAARQLRATREQACDDEVLLAGTRPSDYASCLVDVAKSVKTAKYATPVAVGMACSQLEDRISSILHPARNRRLLSRRSVMMIALIVAALIVPLASLQPFAHTAAPSLTQKKTLQIQEARQAIERAEAEAQQCVEDQRREIELHLRTIEREQRERTGEQRCEIEQQLRELSARKESALAEELQAQQEAALRLEEAQRGVAQLRASEAQLRALELSLRAQQRALSQSELQKRQAEIEARQRELAESRQRLRQEIERAVREGIANGASKSIVESIEKQISDSIRSGIESGIGSGLAAGIGKRISDGIAGTIRESASQGEVMLRLKRTELEAELMRLRTQYTENSPVILEKRDQLEALNQTIEEFIRSRTKSDVQAMLLLRQAELKAQLKTILRSYTETSPEVLALKSQIEVLKKELEQLRK